MSAIIRPSSADFEIVYDFDRVPTVRKLMNDHHRLIGLMGPFGSGKSSGSIMKLIHEAHQQPPMRDGIRRVRIPVIRNTYNQLQDTTIHTFHQWLPPHRFGTYTKHDHTYQIRAFDGLEIDVLFRALDRPDHVANILSLDASFGWVNEAKEVPWSIIEALALRCGRYPSRDQGGVRWPGLILDTNPPDEDSDWYRVFETEKPSNTRIYRQPAGLIARKKPDGGYEILGTNPKAENLASLPQDYYTAGAIGKGGEFIKVFLLGEYGFSSDGLAVFSDYNDNTHYREGLGVHPTAPMWRGWDFGVTTSACAFGQVLPGPRLAILGEVLARGIISTGNFADEVKRYSAEKFPKVKEWHDVGDPTGDNTTPITSEKQQERTNFAVLRGKGIHIQGGTNDLTLRLESVRLGLNTLVGGIPALLVGPGAPTCRKGFLGGYFYRRKRINATQFEEKPYKNEYSHPMDGVQYIAAKIFGGALRTPRNYQPDNRPIGVQPDEEIF